MTARLRLDSDRTVHLDKGTYAWVSVRRFAVVEDGRDAELLTSLLANDWYHDHFAGERVPEQAHHELHGPFRLAAIRPESFTSTSKDAAVGLLREWTESFGSVSSAVHTALRTDVFSVIEGTLYHLSRLPESARHEWGGVVGQLGFHEFVAINRDDMMVTLIVAADD